ncbi:MAG: creatininase family protein [Sphaerochaetaceae bacterium]
MTAEEFKKELNLASGVIIPLASMEQLGLHGPLGADIMVADYIAPLLAEKAGMLFSETIPFGDALEMSDYEGTVSIPTDVLGSFYYNVAASYFRFGAKRILFLMTHSLNSRAADYAARRLYSEGHDACLLDWWKAVTLSAPGIVDDLEFGCGHGGEMITSVVMAISSENVHPERSSNEIPDNEFRSLVKHIYGSGNPCTVYGNFHDYSISGTWGNVKSASAEKGKRLIEKAIDLLISELKETERK